MLSLLVFQPVSGVLAETLSFRDVTRESGIDFVHTDGSSGKRYIVENVASGLATFDYNGDGHIDIFFLNGLELPERSTSGKPTNALYRNEGNWQFTDVTVEAGLTARAFQLGVCVGDFDNDGHSDLFLNNFGPNLLYKNQGDGTFTNVTSASGIDQTDRVGAGACFLDMDADGDLDLFVANYVGFTFDRHHISHMNGFPAYVGPLDYPTTSNQLYRNNGDGTFTDVSESSGIGRIKGSGMGVIAVDIDNDRDTDILVGNDLRPDNLFLNDGHGNFKEVGAIKGIAYDSFGSVLGSMGLECVDWNHDGWLDLYITPYQRQLAPLFQNQAGAFFEDVSRRTGAASDMYAQVKWGVGFVDFDNDRYHDLFIACGHLIDNVDQIDRSTSYRQRNILLQGTGKGGFRNVSETSGDGLQVELSSRGAAFDDLDNDGDLDVVVLNSRAQPTLLRNETRPTNHWLQLGLRGRGSNRDAIGARVTVKLGELTLMDEVHSGRSYQSDFGKRLQFGLGSTEQVDEIRVQWIGGGEDVVKQVTGDRFIWIEEGKGMLP